MANRVTVSMAQHRKPPSKVNCFTCQHRIESSWSVLTDDEVSLLDRSKACRKYLPGEYIFHEGDHCRGVYCVASGLVGIRKTDADGNSVLLPRLACAGDTLGYRPFLAGECHRGSSEIMEPSVICFIRGSAVKELLVHNPILGLQFLARAAKDLGQAEEHYFQSVTFSVRARLAHLLLVLKDRYGEVADDGTLSIELPLSRKDVAALIGARPESTSRAIRQLKEDGVAYFSGQTVHISAVENLVGELGADDHI